MNYPLMFFLGGKVRFCGLLAYDTKLPKDTLKKLNAPLFREENFPDWIVSFGAHGEVRELLTYFSRAHTENGRKMRDRYQLVESSMSTGSRHSARNSSGTALAP